MSNIKKLITLTEEEGEMLERQLGAYSGRKSYSLYLGHLLREEEKRQEAAGKKGPGRPRKVEEDEEVRDIPHPDQIMNPGVFMTQTEFDSYNELRGDPHK